MKYNPFKFTLIAGAACALLSAPVMAKEAKIGESAPDFTLKNLDGVEVKLADHLDKTIVLEWTNYECPFVKKFYVKGDMPGLQKKYTDKGVVWLTISSGPEGKQGNYTASEYKTKAAEHGDASTHILLDRDGKVGKAYGASNTPHMFVISNGKLVYDGAIDSNRSPKQADIADAENYVSKALDEVLAGKPVTKPKTKPYGCGVKY